MNEQVDARVSVLPSGAHGSGQAAGGADGAGSGNGAPRPSQLRECPFCEVRATPEALHEHLMMLHRERVEAAAAYEAALAQGAALEEARAKYNAIVRAALEGGPGLYNRKRQAAG